MRNRVRLVCCILTVAIAVGGVGRANAADHAQWGQRFSRNMVSDEKGLPADFDVESGRNVKWSVKLGSDYYVVVGVTANRASTADFHAPWRSTAAW